MPSPTWLRSVSGRSVSAMSVRSVTWCSGTPSTSPRTPWKITTCSASKPTKYCCITQTRVSAAPPTSAASAASRTTPSLRPSREPGPDRRGRWHDHPAGHGAGERGRRRPGRGGVRRRGVLAAVAHRPAHDRGVLAEVDVDDVGHDAGDVVRAAAAQRQIDHAVGALPWIPVGAQRLGQGLVADHPGQPVRAEQEAVAGPGLPDGQRRVDVLAGERAQQQRALRMRVRLLLGDPALVDQRLDERVVLGDLGQRRRPAAGRPASRRRAPGRAGSRRTGWR